MEHLFIQMTKGETPELNMKLSLPFGRSMVIPRRVQSIAFFDFEQLCGRNYGERTINMSGTRWEGDHVICCAISGKWHNKSHDLLPISLMRLIFYKGQEIMIHWQDHSTLFSYPTFLF